MRSIATLPLALILAVALPGCDKEPTPSTPDTATAPGPITAEVSLPAGDATRGLAAFEKLRCTSCHQVVGHDFPDQELSLRPPKVLGEDVDAVPSDAWFLTAIIDPSHELAPDFDERRIDTGGESIMNDYSYVMNVRQLLDLVTFLRSAYESGVKR